LICFSESAAEQGLEDAAGCRGQKNEIIIEGFEVKIKKLEDSLKEKTAYCAQLKIHSSKRDLRIKN
jgi:hypothetical protein